MDKKGGAKKKTLQHLITNFAVEIGYKADKEKFNKAWHKLWCRISKLGLFEAVTPEKLNKLINELHCRIIDFNKD